MDASPYYSGIHFVLFIPFALIYSTLSRILLRPKINEIIYEETSCSITVSNSKIAIVTGSNTGIGFETARSLVQSKRFSKVILACRSLDKAEAAAERIRQTTITTRSSDDVAVLCLPLDLSDMQSVSNFCDTIKKSICYPNANIHLLVNNAGCNSGGCDRTDDGFNFLFQTNILGHYVLTRRLIQDGLIADDGRIVNLSSVMHHFSGPLLESTVDFWTLVARGTPLLSPSSYQYARSKLAAILFTMELNKRYSPRIKSYAVNPGAVNSDIWRDTPAFVRRLYRIVYLTNRQGCQTTVAACLGSNLPKSFFYLQPYWLPFPGTVSPLFEMLGPFQGYHATKPRLPYDADKASQAMWDAFENVTKQWIKK